ncbi:uncharacterized protein LOC126555611 [Aphis gossypii]|uniref:uncharacterized protein LOC126555611 n=1 Tax=Aphis gossypii TaxID=80765 RepID=UPI0021598117|nr:uncharacterized protein LOC126555611 [Aphis gossypii]XP_050066466.1 uncharacterized protein LOC126555611 [Aphis gossypii]
MVEFEIKKQIPIKNEISIPYHYWKIENFECLSNLKIFNIIPEVLFDAFLNFSDNYLFTEEHNNKIHAILNNFNMLNLTYTEEKQNTDFGKMLHGTLEQMIICSKFNIVYKYIDSFITTNKFTENAYVGNKYLYLNFLCMVHKLEKLRTNLYFDMEMIVTKLTQIEYMSIDMGMYSKYFIFENHEKFSNLEIIIIGTYSWLEKNKYAKFLTMKCLINYVLNFSKILHIHLNKLTSSTFIKKAVSSLEEKQIILCSRSSPKNPYKYYLNTNFIASKHNLNKSKLYSNIIHISPSKFQFYISHILIPINSIDNYILKKQFNLLHKNFFYSSRTS